MAYVPMSQDDEERRRAESGGGALGSFGSSQGAAAPTAPKFVNVADYLSKNPEGSAKIGEAAAGKLVEQRDAASGAVTESGNKFSTDVSAGTTNLDQGLLDSALATPETFVQDPNNTAKFLAMRDAAYKGPNSLQGTDYFAPTQSKVSGLGTTRDSIGTEAGRDALIGSLSTNPTRGKTSLNQLLLQGNDAAAGKIQETAGTFKGVEDQWAKLLAEAPASADAARAATDATRTTTQGRLGETTTAFKGGLSNKLASAENERNAFNLNYGNIDNKLNGQHSGSDLTQRELDDLGISDAFPYLSKLNDFNSPGALPYYGKSKPLSNYVYGGSANTNTPTTGSVASNEDYAREAALQQLSGNDLGLADEREAEYAANGRLPTVDYRGAFGDAGSTLQSSDEGWRPIGDPTVDTNMLYNIQARRGINSGDPTGGTPSNAYYTDPAVGATPGAGYTMAPPPEGWDTNTPPPYGAPTSNPPPGLINPRWNPYTGQWEGARNQPVNPPPPPPGGGRRFY